MPSFCESLLACSITSSERFDCRSRMLAVTLQSSSPVAGMRGRATAGRAFAKTHSDRRASASTGAAAAVSPPSSWSASGARERGDW